MFGKQERGQGQPRKNKTTTAEPEEEEGGEEEKKGEAEGEEEEEEEEENRRINCALELPRVGRPKMFSGKLPQHRPSELAHVPCTCGLRNVAPTPPM